MKNTAKKYLNLLFIALLLILFLGLEKGNREYFAYAFILGFVGSIFISHFPQLKAAIKSLKARLQRKPLNTNSTTQLKPKENITSALLCQFSHRITAKLKSAYPEATWDWATKPNMQSLLDGEVIRIRTASTGDFNHAEMHVDSYGNIILQMMAIQPLDPKTVPTPTAEMPVVVDCSSWFSLLGQKALTDIIGNLNCHGYSNIQLDEIGNVLIEGNDGELSCNATLPHFPGKKYYEELISIFTKAELMATVEKENIKLSW
jgi:hypothetical protein